MLPGIKLFDMTGRSVVITGGSKGLGLAMAEAFASAGGDVMLVSRHGDEAAEAATQLQHAYGRRAIGFAADVSKQPDVAAMTAAAIREFGRIDVLVNNAGV